MNLAYTIVWFEDQPHNVQAIEQGIRQRLERKGLSLRVEWVESFNDLPGILGRLRKVRDEIDLVLLDWDLGRDDDDVAINGADLAKKVRNTLRYTDIVFYSAETAKRLRKEVAERDVDGVYCACRDDLVDEAVGVALRMAKKSLSLESLRGAYVTYATELDHLVTESLRLVYARMTDEERKAFVGRIIRRLKESAKANVKAAEKLGGQDLEGIIKGTRSFGSDQRLLALLQGLDVLDEQHDTSGFSDTLGTYQEDVLTPRNIFAHQRAERKGKKLHFEEDLVLDHGLAEKLRGRLIAHGQNLRDLLDRLDQEGA